MHLGGEVEKSEEFVKRRLLVYTATTFVFGMICSALGPTIPWLANRAGVEPEALGWLPAAQAVMCIISGLASSIMGRVPRKYHHLILCILLVWLAGGFALFPVCSKSILVLTGLFALQVLPRPWIGQMTNLLVSELYKDAASSSAAQSFNQGGFALGAVATLLMSYVAERTEGIENTFYMAAVVTAVTALCCLLLPRLPEENVAHRTTPRCELPTLFTASCAGIGVLAVGVEVACGTWLITSLTQTGFDTGMATAINITFWLLFAISRLAIAPIFIRYFKPEPSTMVMIGATISALCCVPAAFLPHSMLSVTLGVSGVAVGAGPAYAMTLTMAKQRKDLSSADSALFSVSASLGAGGVPFLASRILKAFGAYAFFPSLIAMSALLLLLTALLVRKPPTKKSLAEPDLEAPGPSSTTKEGALPAVIWMWWEQGWETAPLICQACAESWKLANPEAEVRRLDASMLQDWLPDFGACQKLPPAQRADLIRLELLCKYGGVWADATLFCAAPVMPWLQKQFGEESETFFVFDRSSSASWPHDPFLDQNLLISNWFIASSAGHPLIRQWLKVFKESLKQRTIRYFEAHETFRDMLADEQLHEMYMKMPKVSAWHPHLLEFAFGFSAEATEDSKSKLSQSLDVAPMQKLSSKILEDRLFAKIIRDGLSTTLMGSMLALLDKKLQRSYLRKALMRAKSMDLRSFEEREAAAKERVYNNWKLNLTIRSRSNVQSLTDEEEADNMTTDDEEEDTVEAVSTASSSNSNDSVGGAAL